MSPKGDKLVKTLFKQQRKKLREAGYKKPKVFAECDDLAIYTDGGCTKPEREEDPQCAGWGYVVITRGIGANHEDVCEVHSALGLVATDPEHADFQGVGKD